MKKCSSCGREYSQLDLNFCLHDGGALDVIGENTANDLPPTVFSIGAEISSITPPFNQTPVFGNAESASGNNPAFNAPYNPPAQTKKSKLPLILGGLVLLFVLGSGAVLLIGALVWFGSDGNTANTNNKEAQVKARLLDLFGNCQKQNYSAAAEFFYYRGQPIKTDEVERECLPIKNSLDGGNGYEFGNFLTQGAGDNEVNAWEVYFISGAEKIGQIFAFQMINGEYRLVDIDPIPEKVPVVSNTNSGKTFDSLRQQQLGSFRLIKTEKSNYMKNYPSLEEESLTYANSASREVFVNKTRFSSSAEAQRVVRDMIQTAKNGGAQFTEIVPCYSNDGREVGVTATRIADKGGAKNYTIYYSHDNVVTFIFSLENDKAAVDEVFKYGEY
jgi:hypothetical protein